MDTVIHAALEEISCQGANGLLLRNLWPKLAPALASSGIPLCPIVKQDIWDSILEIPGITLDGCREDLIVEECEELNVKIVASEAIRNSFLGIHETEASDAAKLSKDQRDILQCLAVARENGIAQHVLSKDLCIPSKNLFYRLKRLETQGLIVRHPTIIRKKYVSNNGKSKQNIVNTHMLYLFRYRKHLGPQQRLEITMEDNRLMDAEVVNDDSLGGEPKEDVNVKDFLPEIKTICEKLENAEGKVLVVSDLKRDLNYRRMIRGHRAWREICHRAAGVVEECCTIVDNKKVSCLRLLRSFSPSLFGPKFHEHDGDKIDADQIGNWVKQGQITEQLLELPILRQIYDMIDAAGSKGLTNTEVCRRLGLKSKGYHKRYFKQMVTRFGLHLRLETQNRVEVYRVWTARNFNPEPITQDLMESNSRALDLDFPNNLPHPLQIVGSSTSLGDASDATAIENDVAVLTEASISTNPDNEDLRIMTQECIHQGNSDGGPSNEIPDGELPLVCESAPKSTPAEIVVKPPRRRSHPRYPRLTMCSTSRQQHILVMLQEEKFLVTSELLKRLQNLEKEKNTMMDRKTLDRCLNKLKDEGHCKCINVGVLSLKNFGVNKTIGVVLHPSIYSALPEVIDQIHDRIRSFENQVRRQPYTGQKKGQSFPLLDKVQRIPISVTSEGQAEHGEMMRANGFVFAKMIRAKLLHIFLWGWVNNSSCWDDASSSRDHSSDFKNPHSFCKLINLNLAIKSMPLELFLQVVGSTKEIENIVEKCRSGLLLCDLLVQEYKCLMDTRATGRLSWLIYVLRRLKLIRLVSKGQVEDGGGKHMSLTDALELKPYIEEPVSTVASSGSILPDLRPRVRHDFVLSSRKAVDEYWNTLEYCYASAKSTAALLAFPGSAVPEIFHSRSWASVRVMTASQRAELLKCMNNYDAQKKLSFRESEKIAKDLNLTMEQVLCVHYDKKQRLQPVKGKRKRKQISYNVSSDVVMDGVGDGLSLEEKHSLLITSGDYNCQSLEESTCNKIARLEEPEQNKEDEDVSSFISKSALSGLSSARQKFSWTEEADR